MAKTPYRTRMKSSRPFLFAGLWEQWQSDEETVYSTTTITDTNDTLKPIHHRMPVILKPQDYEMWLDPDCSLAKKLQNLLVPYADGELTAEPISAHINNPRNEGPEAIDFKAS